MHPVRAKDGVTLIKDQPGILSRWAEHLLNCINPTDPTFIDLVPQLPIIPDLDQLPTFHDVCVAVKGLKNNKAAGPDGLPAEVFKYGGYSQTSTPPLHRQHLVLGLRSQAVERRQHRDHLQA